MFAFPAALCPPYLKVKLKSFFFVFKSTWKRAIQKSIETAQHDRRIESMQAIVAEEKDRVREKALQRVSDAEELRFRR
jgi:hypothetical protein